MNKHITFCLMSLLAIISTVQAANPDEQEQGVVHCTRGEYPGSDCYCDVNKQKPGKCRINNQSNHPFYSKLICVCPT